MKKKNFIITCSIMLILLGGFQLKKELTKKELIKNEGPRIEKFLTYNYENVIDVTFTNVVFHPTGVPHIKGYVNGNPEMKFDAGISNEHFNAGLNWDDDNKSLVQKEKYKYKSITIEEIEAEEATQ